jgi:polyisoprenoid-binding protein YceI
VNLFAPLAVALALLSPAAAKSWTVDPGHSRLGFEVEAGGTTVTGKFLDWSAIIQFDPADLGNARASVSIDLTRLETGDTRRDGYVTGPQWLNASSGQTSAASDPSNPAIGRFETTAFRQTGANTYEAAGALTLRGSTQAITLPFTLDLSGDTAHMTARVAIDRTRWGIGQGQGADVASNVDVVIDLAAKAAP